MKIDRPVIPLDALENVDYGTKYKLVRERDELTKTAGKAKWIEFENGFGKEAHDTIGVGRSLILGPLNEYFTWQTTVVTEIVEQRDDYIKFKTENSNYELFINEEL